MKQDLFNKKDITPACKYCEHGKAAAQYNQILCVKHGVMLPESSCRKFRYDPLKRQPNRAPILPEFSPEDFAL